MEKIKIDLNNLNDSVNSYNETHEKIKLENISLNELKNELKETIENIRKINRELIKKNHVLEGTNKLLETKLSLINNTEHFIQILLKKHNSWWVADSIEEPVYRKVIKTIQEEINI